MEINELPSHLMIDEGWTVFMFVKPCPIFYEEECDDCSLNHGDILTFRWRLSAN